MIEKQKLSKITMMFVFITVLTLNPRELIAEEVYESFRQDLIIFAESFETSTNNSWLIADIQAMSPEELQQIYSMLPDPSVFSKANEHAEVFQILKRELNSSSNLLQSPIREARSHPSATGFTPDYPSGGNYATYTATLPGLGIMLAGSQNRTDASAVGGAWIAFNTLEIANIGAQAVCDGSLLAAPVACPLAATAALAARATQIVLEQADYQDALIDGAEIEAAFENTKILIDQENGLNTDLAAHDTEIKAQVATHDTDIKTQVATHDTDIKAQLATHDADIKALLANIQGTVDENQRLLKISMSRQLEILRLLITPSGRRVINETVLNCTGDNCPDLATEVISCSSGFGWPCK